MGLEGRGFRRIATLGWLACALIAGGLALGASNTAPAAAEDEQPSISVSNATVIEGDSGATIMKFEVALSKPSSRSVGVTANTAALTTDHQDFAAAGETLSYSPGTTVRKFSVKVAGDLTPEPDEQLKVILTHPKFALIGDGTGIGTILDDDFSKPPAGQAPEVSASAPDRVSIVEGDEQSAMVEIPIQLSKPVDYPVSLKYATQPATAGPPKDYGAVSSGVIFPAGKTSGVARVPIVGDPLAEPDKTFTVTYPEGHLVTPPAPTTVEILDNDGYAEGVPQYVQIDGRYVVPVTRELWAELQAALKCPPGQTPCEGIVRIVTSRAAVQARRAYSVAPGKQNTFRLRLNAEARHDLRAKRRMDGVLIVTSSDAQGRTRTSRRPVTLTAGRGPGVRPRGR